MKGEPKTYTGYKYIVDKSTSSATIETENDLVLKLYYDRIRSDVSYHLKEDTDLPTGSILPVTTSHEFGESISVQLSEAPEGYTVNWTLADAEGIEDLDSHGFTMPAKSVTIIIEFTADSVEPTPDTVAPTPNPTMDDAAQHI
ncbi:MAG: hypothetical protein HFE75_07805 [Firmicutes bacterium]|nr:hypothetical protein [Bacillota bacterium]